MRGPQQSAGQRTPRRAWQAPKPAGNLLNGRADCWTPASHRYALSNPAAAVCAESVNIVSGLQTSNAPVACRSRAMRVSTHCSCGKARNLLLITPELTCSQRQYSKEIPNARRSLQLLWAEAL